MVDRSVSVQSWRFFRQLFWRFVVLGVFWFAEFFFREGNCGLATGLANFGVLPFQPIPV
jgi:hypothetical protein